MMCILCMVRVSIYLYTVQQQTYVLGDIKYVYKGKVY